MTPDEQETIAQAWVAHHRAAISGDRHAADETQWAFARMSDLVFEAPEEVWPIIHTIRRIDGSDKGLAYLAAGPVEELLVYHGAAFIARYEECARQDPQFRKVLGAVWKNAMDDAIWRRLKEIADPPW